MNNDPDTRMGCYRCIAENEHGINNNAKGNEYKTIGMKTQGPTGGA